MNTQLWKGVKQIAVASVCLFAMLYVAVPAALAIPHLLEATLMWVVIIFAGGVGVLLLARGVFDVILSRRK